MRTIIRNATLVNEGLSFLGHLVIEDECISEILLEHESPSAPCDVDIDATGMFLIPGVIDDHVHFRDPGLTHKADIVRESCAAAAGGVTSYMDMPNTIPQTTSIETLEAKFAEASTKSMVNYSFFFGATNDNAAILPFLDKQKLCGVKLFMGSSTGNMLVDRQESLKKIFSDAGMLIMTHCEDQQIIQENTITGTLCFSVHPLDFLSSSENTHNWRSCHSLDGEYRGGNLSYMVDDCTFMCYLRSDGYDHQLPNFPHEVKWNSKKWRVLLYLSNDRTMLMAGRQYPFSSSTGMDRVIKEVFIPERYALWNGVEAHWSGWREGFSSSIKINDEYYIISICSILLTT